MGNSASSSSSRFLPSPGDFRKAFLVKQYSSNQSTTNLESRVSPVAVLVDQGSQTVEQSPLSFHRLKQSSLGCSIAQLVIRCTVVYITVCVLFASSPMAQSVLMFLNFARYPTGDLTELHRFKLHNSRNIEVVTDDGIRLKGYHILPSHLFWSENVTSLLSDDDFDDLLRAADRVVVYFHGSGGTRASPLRLQIVKQISAFLNSHVITVDYRGFGDSEGWPSEEGVYLDGMATLSWLHSRTASNSSVASLNSSSVYRPPLFLYGQSLGSAVAIETAFRANSFLAGTVTGVVLDAPMSSAQSGASTHPVGAFLRVFPIIRDFM